MCHTFHLFSCALLLSPIGHHGDTGFGDLVIDGYPPGVVVLEPASESYDLELLRPASPLVRLRGFTAGVPGTMGELTSADLP